MRTLLLLLLPLADARFRAGEYVKATHYTESVRLMGALESRCLPTEGLGLLGRVIKDDGSTILPFHVECIEPEGRVTYYDAGELEEVDVLQVLRMQVALNQPTDPAKGFAVGQKVRFVMDDGAIDFPRACPGKARHYFTVGTEDTIAEIEGGCFRSTTYGVLWAPLSALSPRSLGPALPAAKGFAVGQKVRFTMDSDAADFAHDCPGKATHIFADGMEDSIAEIEGSCFRSAKYEVLWAPLSALDVAPAQAPPGDSDPCAPIASCSPCTESPVCKWCPGERKCSPLSAMATCAGGWLYGESQCPASPRAPLAFKVGDEVTFAEWDAAADFSGLPRHASRLAFYEGMALTIHRIEGAFFTSTRWTNLWAPLRSLRGGEAAPAAAPTAPPPAAPAPKPAYSAAAATWELPGPREDRGLRVSFRFQSLLSREANAFGIEVREAGSAAFKRHGLTEHRQGGALRCLDSSDQLIPAEDCNFESTSRVTLGVAGSELRLHVGEGFSYTLSRALPTRGEFRLYATGGRISEVEIKTKEEAFLERHLKNGAAQNFADAGAVCERGVGLAECGGKCFYVCEGCGPPRYCMCYAHGYKVRRAGRPARAMPPPPPRTPPMSHARNPRTHQPPRPPLRAHAGCGWQLEGWRKLPEI